MTDDRRTRVIHEVQGALRDALSALQNLAVLLRSVRVGPRPIAAVLAEIRQTVAVVPAAVGAMNQALGLDAEPAARLLADFAAACAGDICRALQQAEDTSLEARPRLALEAEVQRLIPRLDAVRGQVDLLLLLDAPAIELDAAELLHAALTPPSRAGFVGPSVRLSATLLARGQHLVHVPPQVVSPLLLLALGHVHGDGLRWRHDEAGLRVHRHEDQLRLALDDRPEPGEVVLLRPFLCVPTTAPVLELFCRRQGTCVELGDDASASLALALVV